MRFVFGECELDMERYELRRAGRVITLEPKAFRVLAYLLQHHGRAVAKRDLLQAFWPGTSDESYLEYALRNCLYKIRQAVGDAGTQGAVIETVRGYGYRFGAAVTSPVTDFIAAPAEPTGVTDERAQSHPRAPSIARPGRRQLTVLRCELMQEPTWDGMDVEDFQALAQSFSTACTRVIQRFDGYIAQHDNDAFLVYFGYPTADEEAAQRAVWTGLALVEAAQHLVVPMEWVRGDAPTVRVGIHTGQVVEGQGHPVSPISALSGPALMLAKRAQAYAQPATVVITAETHHLVQGYFTCQPLNEQHSTENEDGLIRYRVLGVSGLHTRFEVASSRGLTPFVGREPELALLRYHWEQVRDGIGHMLILSGEPGIGKSRLLQVLKDHVAAQSHLRWECRSSPFYQQTPLFPLMAFFHRALQWQPGDTQAEKLEKLECALRQYRLPIDETVPLFASWLSVSMPEALYPPFMLSSQQQRQKMLERIVAILLQLAERQPMLFILEDAHWADPSTLELLELMLEQLPTAAIYVVLTCRPTFQPFWRPRSSLTQLTLNRLSQHESEAMLTQIVHGKALPPEVLTHVVSKTDGVPLFVEALLTMILETGLVQEEADRYVLTGSLPLTAIPATLQDLLMACLDRLVEARDVVQFAAVLGRQFSYALLQAVSSLDAPTLQAQLARAKDLELIYQRGIPPQAYYRFKHALIQEAAYHSLLKRTRQQMHERVAQVLEAQFPDVVATQPELLAHHYTEAGHAIRAVPYWHQASQQAIARSAYVEARHHLIQGLDVLLALPETPARAQQELPLRIALGRVLMMIQGQAAPEVEQAYARALALCQQIDTTPQLFPALAGLCGFYVMRGGLQTARELAVELLSLAECEQDLDLLLQAHQALGGVLLHRGEVAAAYRHWQQVMVRCDPRRERPRVTPGCDLRVLCLSYMAWCLWLLGYPIQAQQRSHQALSLAQNLAHPFTCVFALNYAAWLAYLYRDTPGARAWAEASIQLATELGVPDFLAAATMARGWSLAIHDHSEAGLSQLRQGIAAYRATGAELHMTSVLVLLAQTCGHLGHAQEGLTALEEAFILGERYGEHYYAAELYRLKGELLLTASMDDYLEATTCFQQALAIARQQQARAWELRAATSLARLWQQRGKRDDARSLLALVYSGFTEGFDTADLRDAQVLLDALSG